MATVEELQAEIDAARAEVQRAVALLVNRFGHEADVFAVLTAALSHLRETPLPRVENMVAVAEEVAATEEPAEPEASGVSEEVEPEVEPEVPPEAPRQYRRRRG